MILTLLVAVTTAGSATDAHSSAAVVAADARWEAAEINGDANYLEQLLLPSYVSVAADGKITTKAEIVDRARSRSAAERASRAKVVESWRAMHPVHAQVTIDGNTAVLQWTLPTQLVSSSDVFVYEGGHWCAAYSQHSSASR